MKGIALAHFGFIPYSIPQKDRNEGILSAFVSNLNAKKVAVGTIVASFTLGNLALDYLARQVDNSAVPVFQSQPNVQVLQQTNQVLINQVPQSQQSAPRTSSIPAVVPNQMTPGMQSRMALMEMTKNDGRGNRYDAFSKSYY